MIGLIAVMLRSRRVQALIAFGVAAIAVASAVAAPLYVAVAERVLIAADVAAATPAQLAITADYAAVTYADPLTEDKDYLADQLDRVEHARLYERDAPAAMHADGFTTVFSTAMRVFAQPGDVPDEAPTNDGNLSFRQDFCAHVIITAGRCVAAPGEVIVSGARSATGLAVGAGLNVAAVTLVPGGLGEPAFYARVGDTAALGVVGTYEPRDRHDVYWGREAAEFEAPLLGPILTARATFDSVPHTNELFSIISYVSRDSLTVDTLAQYQSRVKETLTKATPYGPTSDADSLVAKVAADRAAVAVVPGVAALPVVALCWFVLFLAIAHAAQSRRGELGMVKLRGASTGDQWWLSTAESFLSVLAGGVLGYLLGHVAVWAYAWSALGVRTALPITSDPLPYAALALIGGLIAGLLAVRRDLASSPTELLRRVPARGGTWRGVSLAVTVLVLAGVAVAQVRSDPAAQNGLARLAPALAILGLGLLCAVVVDPVAAALGRWALRRGRLGLGIGALQVGSTPHRATGGDAGHRRDRAADVRRHRRRGGRRPAGRRGDDLGRCRSGADGVGRPPGRAVGQGTFGRSGRRLRHGRPAGAHGEQAEPAGGGRDPAAERRGLAVGRAVGGRRRGQAAPGPRTRP